jgi:ketosteroid isomerase-like protein
MPTDGASSAPRPNAALVARLYEAFARRDLPTIFGLLAPDVEIYQASEIPWGGRYQGHEAAATFFAKLVGTITSSVTLERLIDAGDQVVAIGRTRGTVNASGREFDVPVAHVWTIRDGLCARVEYYIDDPTMLRAF